jgi:hypothetical protein
MPGQIALDSMALMSKELLPELRKIDAKPSL